MKNFWSELYLNIFIMGSNRVRKSKDAYGQASEIMKFLFLMVAGLVVLLLITWIIVFIVQNIQTSL